MEVKLFVDTSHKAGAVYTPIQSAMVEMMSLRFNHFQTASRLARTNGTLFDRTLNCVYQMTRGDMLDRRKTNCKIVGCIFLNLNISILNLQEHVSC